MMLFKRFENHQQWYFIVTSEGKLDEKGNANKLSSELILIFESAETTLFYFENDNKYTCLFWM